MRGDEPTWTLIQRKWTCEFPACAGMNRQKMVRRSLPRRVPRMRGDEPALGDSANPGLESSPHARG